MTELRSPDQVVILQTLDKRGEHMVSDSAPNPRPGPRREPSDTTPGGRLLATLRDLKMSQVELARLLHRTPKYVSEIVRGHVVITAALAVEIEKVTGLSAARLMELETNRALAKARARKGSGQ
jgi:addiction module HigA family antidote